MHLFTYLIHISLVLASSIVYSYNISAKVRCRINNNCNDCKVLSSFAKDSYLNVSELIVAAIENEWKAVDYLIGKKIIRKKLVLKTLFIESN